MTKKYEELQNLCTIREEEINKLKSIHVEKNFSQDDFEKQDVVVTIEEDVVVTEVEPIVTKDEQVVTEEEHVVTTSQEETEQEEKLTTENNQEFKIFIHSYNDKITNDEEIFDNDNLFNEIILKSKNINTDNNVCKTKIHILIIE